ncbi:MAG: secretin N-terminal domain-containing protein [Pseudomonadota bacterium]
MTNKNLTVPPKLRLVAMALSILIAGCAAMEHAKGLSELKNDMPDQGIADLKSAAKRAKTNAEYKIDFLQNRDEQIREILRNGDMHRANGEIGHAQRAYERALKMDAGNDAVLNAMKGLKQDARYIELLVDGEMFLEHGRFDLALERAAQVLQEFPKNQRALKLRDEATDAKTASEIKRAKVLALRVTLDTLVTLQFSDATLKSVFESLSKSTSLNVLFDRDVKQDAKSTVFVTNVSVSDAIDLLLMQHQLRKRVINGNTLLIYPANAAKVDEYEDLYIKTFQITNADIKYLASMLKTMLKLKEMSADEKTGIMVIRDTPESLRLAERLIAAHDVADPEIMLEVEVLEVGESRDSNLGFAPPTSLTISTPGSAAAPMTAGALSRFNLDNLNVTPLSGTINFKLNDMDAKILASPRIRARNKEQAKIMIGDRVPTITNTVTPINTGASVVTGNVTYQDVGLKLEFEPQVYADNEVGIKISLEVSNIAKEFTDTNGGRSYQIGTRNASTNLRLKDGETQILGGLITDEDRNTAAKIPGLGHIPFFGRLFGNNAGASNRSEIILAITPRIVRNLAVRTPDSKNIFSGTYNAVREKPILADPIEKLTVSGTFGASGGPVASAATSVVPAVATSGGVLINPAPTKTSTSIGPTTANPFPVPGQPLAPPPPMATRPGAGR